MAEGTQIAKAYVQLVPTTKDFASNIKAGIGGDAEAAGQSAGVDLGNGLVSKLKAIIVAAGIGNIIKDALNAGGDLQQSFGGLDTLYGEASQAAKDYAREASAAGISMNDYAEQAVSFGAALKSAFEGDTTKAVEAANTAILDMTDNAAKMGTPLESIQNAYQGFAKQNYTMLDNLKLGYGGTKEEMERLLADATKLSGVEYNLDNLGDVYSAIHVIQQDLGMTGTAAAEASTTFTGSMGAMKAAATNFLAALTTDGDVQGTLSTLISSTGTFLFDNLLPMLGSLIKALPGAIATFISEAGPMLMSNGMELITNLSSGVQQAIPELLANALPMIVGFTSNLRENFGQIVDAGIELLLNLVQGIADSLPTLIEYVPTIVSNIAGLINDNGPKILKAGIQIIITLVKGLINSIPTILENMPKIIGAIIDVISAVNWLNLGAKIIKGIASGLGSMAGHFGRSASEVLKSIWTTIKNTNWAEMGKNIIQGILAGLKNAAHSLLKFIVDLCASMFYKIKDFFKIGSPSKLMNREVGRWIPAGLAVGIEDNMGTVTSAMDDLNNESLGMFDTSVLQMSNSPIASSSADSTAVNALSDKLDVFGSNLIESMKHLTVQATVDGDDVFEKMRIQSSNYKEQTGKLAFG